MEGVEYRMGASGFSTLSGELIWNGASRLRVEGRGGKVALAELVPWLEGLFPLLEGTQSVRGMEGTLSVPSVRVEGPLLHPGKWRYEVEPEPLQVRLDLEGVPGPLRLRGGGSIGSTSWGGSWPPSTCPEP